MKCRAFKFQCHSYNISRAMYVARGKGEKNDEHWIFVPFASFFFKIRLSSAISLLRQFRLLSIRLPLSRLFDFWKFSCCLVLMRFAGAIAASAANCATARRPVGPAFVNCRGGEVGNSGYTW